MIWAVVAVVWLVMSAVGILTVLGASQARRRG